MEKNGPAQNTVFAKDTKLLALRMRTNPKIISVAFIELFCQGNVITGHNVRFSFRKRFEWSAIFIKLAFPNLKSDNRMFRIFIARDIIFFHSFYWLLFQFHHRKKAQKALKLGILGNTYWWANPVLEGWLWAGFSTLFWTWAPTSLSFWQDTNLGLNQVFKDGSEWTSAPLVIASLSLS